MELSTLSISDPNANEIVGLIKTGPVLLSKRAPASRRMRSTTYTNTELNFPPIGAGSGAPPPSRRREQAEALENLRKRVSPALLRKQYSGAAAAAAGNNGNNGAESAREKVRANGYEAEDTDDEEQEYCYETRREIARRQAMLDNRPQLLQKILQSRAICLVSEPDGEEGSTAWQDSDFISDALCWHNVYRQRHGVPALTMSPELCSFAQTWANHLAHTNKFYYRSDREVGQNLFCRPANVIQTEVTGQEVSTYWYGAVRQYDYFKEPDVLHANVNAGHFTQMVWASTRYFGIGKARSRSGKILIVAHYAPPGNTSGGFYENVRPPGVDDSTVSGVGGPTTQQPPTHNPITSSNPIPMTSLVMPMNECNQSYTSVQLKRKGQHRRRLNTNRDVINDFNDDTMMMNNRDVMNDNCDDVMSVSTDSSTGGSTRNSSDMTI